MSTVIGAKRRVGHTSHISIEYPPLCSEPFGEITKHLLYHILPLGGEHEWALNKNIKKVCEGISQFNGKRIVTIATTGEGDTKPFVCPDDVIKKFESHGVADIEYMFIKNKKRLREVTSFIPMLEKVASTDPNEVIFYGHCKGVSHPDPNSICHKWADCMYETVYDNWDQAKQQLQVFGMSGSFNKYGTFKTVRNHKWHYSGTFYWMRSASVFVRKWKQVDQLFYGTESWPGLLFRPWEAGCLFHDFTGDVYTTSPSILEQKINEWRHQKLNGGIPEVSLEQRKQLLLDKQPGCVMSY